MFLPWPLLPAQGLYSFLFSLPLSLSSSTLSILFFPLLCNVSLVFSLLYSLYSLSSALLLSPSPCSLLLSLNSDLSCCFWPTLLSLHYTLSWNTMQHASVFPCHHPYDKCSTLIFTVHISSQFQTFCIPAEFSQSHLVLTVLRSK